jgi:AcrR family transcriptional regulator
MSSLPSRQERRKQRTRQRILAAARELIAERGYDATNVKDITATADVSKGTFYLYFNDKEALTRTLIEEGFAELRAELDAIINQRHQDIKDGTVVHQALLAFFEYAAANQEQFLIMLGRQAPAELTRIALDTFTDMVQDIIHNNAEAQRVEPYKPALLAHFVSGAVVRLAIWWLEGHTGDLSPPAITDLCYQLLVGGVLSVVPDDPTG